MRYKLIRALVNGIIITIVMLLSLYLVPKFIICLSDFIIATGISEVWLAFGTGIGTGVLIGFIVTYVILNRGI